MGWIPVVNIQIGDVVAFEEIKDPDMPQRITRSTGVVLGWVDAWCVEIQVDLEDPDWEPDRRAITRACATEWIASIVTQCQSAHTPVFVKQLGTRSFVAGYRNVLDDPKGGQMSEWRDDLRVRQVPGGLWVERSGRAAIDAMEEGAR